MAAWAVNADNLRASSVKTAIKNTGIKCVIKLLYTGRHFWNRKCRKKTWWQQEFAVFKCEATANSVTGHVCVNSNKRTFQKKGKRRAGYEKRNMCDIMSAEETNAAAKQTYSFLAPLTNEQPCEAGR